ncbi:hypothetical protein [Endozoicomonas ascidiicola]|uniref:hypothetical protein n=1 Tax=Endozoicomonas ascidiicola TaxID=1698521 RepID=UPI000834E641|nr:hypothetical protein [Endozoicomonas ascidiicola]
MNKLVKFLGGLGYPISIVIITNFLIVGVVASYLDFPQIYWLGYIIPIINVFSRTAKHSVQRKEIVLVIIWFVYLTINWLFWTKGIALKTISIKDYIIPTLVLFIVSKITFDEYQLNYMYKLLRVVVLVQPLFIFQQFFYIAVSTSKRAFDWDLITGTFGFNYEGGGGNSAGLLLLLCFFIVVCLEKIRLSSASRTDYVALASSMVSILMMETKIVVILSLFAGLALTRKGDVFKLSYFMKIFVLLPAFILIVIYSYNANFSTGDKAGRTLEMYMLDISNSYSDELINFDTGEVGRQSSLLLWWERNFKYGITFDSVFGHGLTSSKFSNSGIYDAVSYGSRINFASIQLTTLLWDVGLFGVMLCMLVLLSKSIYFLKARAASVYISSFRRGGIFLALSFPLYSIYSNVLFSNPISYTIFILFFSINFREVGKSC